MIYYKMNQKLCLLICFFVGVLVFYLLKNTCGCKVVEGVATTGQCANTDPAPTGMDCSTILAAECSTITDSPTCNRMSNNGCCKWTPNATCSRAQRTAVNAYLTGAQKSKNDDAIKLYKNPLCSSANMPAQGSMPEQPAPDRLNTVLADCLLDAPNDGTTLMSQVNIACSENPDLQHTMGTELPTAINDLLEKTADGSDNIYLETGCCGPAVTGGGG